MKKHVVIIGAGFGGVEAARCLAKHEDQVEITIVSKQENFLYYPALYKLAAQDTTAFSDLRWKNMIPKSVNFVVDEVISIDRNSKKISFFKREDLSYDVLILALGSVIEDFGIPGVRENMCQFRTLEDIHCLRTIITEHKKAHHKEPIIIVGGGPTGVELAACIQKVFDEDKSNKNNIHNHVLIIEASPNIVGQLPEKARYAIKNRLIDIGVGIHTGMKVLSYDGQTLKTATGDFTSNTVAWTAGLVANPLLKDIGGEYDKRGRIMVNEYLETVVDENIFAIGDSASTMRAGLAQTAIYDGKFVADTIINKINNKKRPIYEAPSVGYAVPVGPMWGVASFGKIMFTGIIGSLVRDLVDLHYLITHTHFKIARRIFRISHRN